MWMPEYNTRAEDVERAYLDGKKDLAASSRHNFAKRLVYPGSLERFGCGIHLKSRYQMLDAPIFSFGAGIRETTSRIEKDRKITMPSQQSLPIAIYYEQPNWFKPLFAELDRRGTNYVKLDAVEHSYGPGDKPEEKYALVLNKMSPSAWNRGHGDQIFYTLGYLEHLESRGVRVVNGVKAFRSELSKATQLAMLEGLGLGYPKARVIHRASQASAAAEGLRFPVVVKPNIGGSGSGVVKFNTKEHLAEAAGTEGGLTLGMDSTGLVQEFVPARGSYIVRVEVLDGKYLYAIKIHITGETFDLCPADICKTPTGQELVRSACPVDAPKTGLTVEAFDTPPEVIEEVERLMAAAGIELGGVEFMVDDRDGRRVYYDINALSNFVADGPKVVGFDPFARLADWLEAEAKIVNDRRAGVQELAEVGR
jgi:glutathione synthase/RimK-type ligase-like ATP-grasp enzyme